MSNAIDGVGTDSDTAEFDAVEPANSSYSEHIALQRLSGLKNLISPLLDTVFETVPDLLDEVDDYLEDENIDDFSKLQPRVIDELEFDAFCSIAGFKMNLSTTGNSYHNFAHVEDVKKLLIDFISCLEGNGVDFSDYEKQCLILAAVLHDFDHCGKIGNGPDFEVNMKRTLEKSDEFMKSMSIELRMRLDVLSLIAGTTSFHSSIKPKTSKEALLVLADLGKCWEGFGPFLVNDTKVCMEMDKKMLSSIDDWARNTISFLEGYCKDMSSYIRSIFEKEGKIGFQDFLDEYEIRREKCLEQAREFIEEVRSDENHPHRLRIQAIIDQKE